MNEIPQNLSKNSKKMCFPLGKKKFQTHWKCTYHKIFDLRKGPEYLYRLFDVLPKHTTCKMKALQVQVYIQQWFYNEQRVYVKFNVSSEIRNGFGHVLICWWAALLVKIR